jgi:hypothetical protein
MLKTTAWQCAQAGRAVRLLFVYDVLAGVAQIFTLLGKVPA